METHYTTAWQEQAEQLSKKGEGLRPSIQVDTASPASVPDQASSRRVVLLAYQDLPHQRLGRAYWEKLSTRLGGDVDTSFTEWKFEMLAHPALTKMAADEAKAAQLVVIATDSMGPLPAAVRTWIESWSGRASVEPAILAIVLSESAACPAIHWAEYAFLKRQADQCNRRLILYSSGRPLGEEDAFSETDARPVGQPTAERAGDCVELTILAGS